MLVFLALGDYPELHKDLRQLLSGRGKCNKGKWWLDGFIKYAHQPLDGAQIGLEKPGGYDNSELVGIVVEYLASICLDGPKQEVERFGEVLAGAAELRNDSNYEALLIAHEYNHEFLSPAFEELATLLIEATDNVLPFACTAFNNFIIHDAAWGKERETYGSFARDYLQQRLVRGIGEKLCAVPVHERKALEHKVQGFIAGIANCFNDSDYQQLEDAVSFDVFHCKNGLMHQFQKKIDALVNAIRAN
jgi:hypothetical protein